MLKKLKVKFVVITMLIVTIMLGVIFGLVYYFTAKGLEQSSILMMQNIAVTPFQPGVPGEENTDVQLPYFVLRVDEEGELITSDGGYYDLSDEEMLGDLVDVSFASSEDVGVIEEYKLRFCKVEISDFYVIVFSDISSEIKTLKNLAESCAIIGVISFLVFLAISILLARWSVKPVDEAWQQQREFIADASHELKTPLTVITTNAEIMVNPEYDEASKVKCSENILSMSFRMRSLVEDLLNLAKADRGREDMLMEKLDLGEVIKDALLPFEALFYEQGLELVTGIQQRIYIKGSKKELEQLVSILLDNAGKYALKTEPVYVKLWTSGRKKCHLSISNGSAPLSCKQLKDIFKRFNRVDSTAGTTDGHGLGLSIAERIVAAHRGKIRASYEDGVITITAEFPVCLSGKG